MHIANYRKQAFWLAIFSSDSASLFPLQIEALSTHSCKGFPPSVFKWIPSRESLLPEEKVLIRPKNCGAGLRGILLQGPVQHMIKDMLGFNSPKHSYTPPLSFFCVFGTCTMSETTI